MSKKVAKGGGSNTLIKNTTKALEESILDIINDISKRQYSLDFREPVDVKALGLNDYYDIIKKPMDLSTLKNNFLEGVYKTIKEIWDDFDLIVNNCKTYNRIPDHPINQKADQMKGRVDKSFQKLIEDYKTSGVDPENYNLQIDLEDLRAKEEKKRKIKLDGLDEKNILMGGDKRLYIPPGSLNERKLFELQNQDLQMMQQSGRVPMLPLLQQTSSIQEDQFQPNSLKISLIPSLGMSQSQIISTPSMTGEPITPSNNQVAVKQPKLVTAPSIVVDGAQQPKKVKDNTVKVAENTPKAASSSLKAEYDSLLKRKTDIERQRILCKNVFILSKKQKRGIVLSIETFEAEENNLVNPNPNGTMNNLPTQTNLNGSTSKYQSDLNDATTSGTSLKTPQKREFNSNNEDNRSKQMEIENGETEKNNKEDDDDDDIVIKKKGNPLEDSVQKVNERGEGEMNGSQNGPTKIKIPSSSVSSTLNKEASSSTQLNDSKVSSKQLQAGSKSNNDSNIYSTPTKANLLNSSNLSSEKLKQNAKSGNLNTSDSKIQNTMNEDEESEEEFKPTSLNTAKQQPSESSSNLQQQSQPLKMHGLKATSSTASSAHLKHKQQASASGEKLHIKRTFDPNNPARKDMTTPEKKSLSLGKRDVTPEKLNKLNQGGNNTHSHHIKQNSSGKLKSFNGSQNGQTSQTNLSPSSHELKLKKLGAHPTPPKSALSQQGKATINGNIQPQKKPPTEGLIRITQGGEQIQKISQEGVHPMKAKKTEDGLKIKIKDPSLKTEKEGEEKKSTKITLPIFPGSGILPAPELKQSQSMKAAQILQMGQDKKNREIEEKQKTEEQKRQEEHKKRQNLLQKKAQKLLQAHQQKVAADAAAAALANNNAETGESKNSMNTSTAASDTPKIILMKNPSVKPEETSSVTSGQNLIKITLDPSKMPSSQSQSNVDIGLNSKLIYDKIIPSAKPKKSQSIQSAESNANAASANLNFNKIKINLGGSPVVPPSNLPAGASSANPALQNFPVPQISVGGERVDFKFVMDRKTLRKEYESMIKRKQQKYKKLLEVNLTKMQKVTNWMIKEWAKQKKDVRSETLDYFRDILNERQKIKDNLDIRKIQLFLKMFLYRLRDFYKDLKSDYIDKLKNISEKMYRIGSRAIVYKTPLSHRDNPKNAACDQQVNNNQILEESHPLKKLQEEILEIEREMKLFRRMLSRDIQKYQEQPDAAAQKTKKQKNKDESNQYNGANEQDQQSGYMNAGQGFEDSKDVYGVGDKDQQQKQSEILSYFLEYNKQFEKQTSDLNRIQNFLAAQISSNLLNSLINKPLTRSDQLYDICETLVEDEDNNKVEILDYIKKKRKVSSTYSSSDSSSHRNAETKIEEEQSKLSEEEMNPNLFDNVTLSFNFNTNQKSSDDDYETDHLNSRSLNQNTSKLPQNIFSAFGNDDDETEDNEEQEYRKYKERLGGVQKNFKDLNNGAESIEKAGNYGLKSHSISDFNYFGVKRVDTMIQNQIIDNKFIFDLKKYTKRSKILEVGQRKIKQIIVFQKKKLSQEQNFKLLYAIPNIKWRNLDESSFQTSISGLLNMIIQIELKLESEQVSSQMDLENAPKQEEKFLEFHIKNVINSNAYGEFAEIDFIKKQLQLNCKENADLYATLCSEEVEQVVQSFKVQKQLRRFTDYDGCPTQEQINQDTASLMKLMHSNKIDSNQRHSIYSIELSLWLPINKLTDLEIAFNGSDLFNPSKAILQYEKMQYMKKENQKLKQQTQQH